VLDLYAEEADPRRPVVCFDESPTQLIGEVREPIPAAPGQPERYDYEYKRNGTANLFVFLDVHKSWRHVKVTDHRTARDFAECMRDLADFHYPDADRIRVVMDNLSTHTAGALYEAFPAPEAHRVLQRLEFHYTPKHASWLNMVEIEIGVLRGQCLDRRIGERDVLVSEIDACSPGSRNGPPVLLDLAPSDASSQAQVIKARSLAPLIGLLPSEDTQGIIAALDAGVDDSIANVRAGRACCAYPQGPPPRHLAPRRGTLLQFAIATDRPGVPPIAAVARIRYRGFSSNC
jgi:hypothetical protein